MDVPLTAQPHADPLLPGHGNADPATRLVHGDAEALRLLVASVMDYAIFMLDPQGHILTWNPGAERIKGYHASEVIGKHFSLFYTRADIERGHPDKELQIAAEHGRYEEEGWRCRKDGSVLWANVVITALRDERGILQGFGKVTRDLTERKAAEDALREATELLEERVQERTAKLNAANVTLRRREQDLTDFVENAAIGLHWVGADGTILWANKAELDLLGYSPEEYIGHPIAEFHVDAATIQDILNRLSSNETLHEYEARIRCKDGSIRNVLINSNVMWEDGQFRHTRCFTRDVTEHRKAERRQEFIVEASRVLASSLDYKATLESVARLAVPAVADWSAVDMLDGEGRIQRLAVQHVDPAKVALAYELEVRYPADLSAPHGLPRVLHTGEAEYYPDIPDSLLVATCRDEEHLRLVRALGLKSAIIVPLVIRGRTLGAITLVTAESGRDYTPEDYALAQDLAQRASLAVDNARLYTAAQEEIAERRRAEAALRQSDERYQRAARAGRVGVWEWQVGAEELFLSSDLKALLGYTDAELPNTMAAWCELVHPDDKDQVIAATQAYLDGAAPRYEVEVRRRHKSGEYRWFVARGEVQRDKNGHPIRLTGSDTDITERRAHLELLQEQREELEVANEELQAANEELADQQAELEAANLELHEHQGQLLQVANALRHSEAALQEQTQTLETVNRIGQLLAAELDLQKLLQALTDAATEISEAQFGSFFYNTLNEEGQAYVLYTLSGAPRSAFEKFPLPRNTAIFAPTFAGEGTVRLGDVTRDARFGHNPPYGGMPKGHLPVRSYLAVPVKSRSGEVLGGLFFGHAVPEVFTERHARLVEGVAAQAAVAIDNARLYRQARAAETLQQRRAREAALIADAGVALSEIAELPAMLGRVTDAVVRHLDAAFARIWTLNEAEQVLELQASSGRYTHLDGPHSRIPVGSFKIGLIAAERKPHLSNEVVTDPRVSDQEWARREGMVAFAGYPLITGDRLLGVMALFARQPLAEDALDALGSIADILAQGIERKRLEREVQERAEALAEADRRKDEFLAMLGHELRNPLSPALTALHVLKERSPEDPAFGRARDVAERQLRNMARLVDDLLDVSRITRGKIELRKAPLDLRTLVLRSVEALRPQIEARRHELICSLPEEPVHVQADLTRMDQVLTNLLTNAAKYTDPGGKIWLTLDREGADAVIRVRDTGVGIPKKLLPHLFDLFVQSERSLDRAQGGLGIGLTLVRRLVEMHGGTVAAASPGSHQGSEFVVRLPALTETPAGETGLPPVQAATPSQSGFRILVVDDNQDAADTTAELLADLGHTVVCAHDGPGAIKKAYQEHPLDAILMDIGLPILSGYEVAQRLRADERFQNTLLIALTGYGSAEDQRRSQEVGFDYHLVKPVEPAAFLRLLAELRPGSPAP